MDKKIKCLYSKCDVEFEPKNTKTRFCSAKHRVMWHREQGKPEPIIVETKLPPKKETQSTQPTELGWREKLELHKRSLKK